MKISLKNLSSRWQPRQTIQCWQCSAKTPSKQQWYTQRGHTKCHSESVTNVFSIFISCCHPITRVNCVHAFITMALKAWSVGMPNWEVAGSNTLLIMWDTAVHRLNLSCATHKYTREKRKKSMLLSYGNQSPDLNPVPNKWPPLLCAYVKSQLSNHSLYFWGNHMYQHLYLDVTLHSPWLNLDVPAEYVIKPRVQVYLVLFNVAVQVICA